jgi:hypothetical protein
MRELKRMRVESQQKFERLEQQRRQEHAASGGVARGLVLKVEEHAQGADPQAAEPESN